MAIIVYIAILGVLRLALPSKSYSKKIFVVTAGFLLFLISALRSINFGPDSFGYAIKYLSLSYESTTVLYENMITNTGKDPTFYFVAKLISLTGATYQVWFASIAALFCYSVSKLIYKYSSEPYISFVALISLGYFYFSMTGLRQTVALSFIILSYKYLRERKPIQFVLLVLIGSLFHSTAIIFLIAYPVINMKIGWKQTTGISVAFLLAYFFKEEILNLLGLFLKSDRFYYYINHGETLTISGFIIQMFIYLFCLYYKRSVLKSNITNLYLYNLLFMGLVFQAFATVIAEFFRVSMYFSVFGILLIPNIISSIKYKKNRVLIYTFVLIALVAYIFWTGNFNDFKFYWQT